MTKWYESIGNAILGMPVFGNNEKHTYAFGKNNLTGTVDPTQEIYDYEVSNIYPFKNEVFGKSSKGWSEKYGTVHLELEQYNNPNSDFNRRVKFYKDRDKSIGNYNAYPRNMRMQTSDHPNTHVAGRGRRFTPIDGEDYTNLEENEEGIHGGTLWFMQHPNWKVKGGRRKNKRKRNNKYG